MCVEVNDVPFYVVGLVVVIAVIVIAWLGRTR